MQPPTHTLKKVPWASRYSYAITVLAYIVSQLFTVIPIIVAAFFIGSDAVEDNFLDQPWMSLSLTGVGALGLFVVLYGFMKVKRYPINLLKASNKLPVKSIVLVIGIYLAYLLLMILVLSIVSVFVPSFNVEEEQIIGYKDAYGWQLLLAFIGLVIIPPISEELLFRGFLYQGLRDHWHSADALKWGLGIAVVVAAFVAPLAGLVIALGIYVAIILGKKHPARAAALITSLLFGLVHMQWNVAIDTFIFSFALIYVFEKTQNLWAAIALHALKNGVAFIGIFLLS